MKSVIAAVLSFLLAAVHAQSAYPATSGHSTGSTGTYGTGSSYGTGSTYGTGSSYGSMDPMMMYQNYLLQSSIYDVNPLRVAYANQLAQAYGNSPWSRYYVGEYLDMPDMWWLGSSLFNGQMNPAFAALALDKK